LHSAHLSDFAAAVRCALICMCGFRAETAPQAHICVYILYLLFFLGRRRTWVEGGVRSSFALIVLARRMLTFCLLFRKSSRDVVLG